MCLSKDAGSSKIMAKLALDVSHLEEQQDKSIGQALSNVVKRVLKEAPRILTSGQL